MDGYELLKPGSWYRKSPPPRIVAGQVLSHIGDPGPFGIQINKIKLIRPTVSGSWPKIAYWDVVEVKESGESEVFKLAEPYIKNRYK